ncbi:MAG: YggT family protein [Gammaproteobacteria bacterium]|nr:YggT family protein [Gammaproteobacteria bacterium]
MSALFIQIALFLINILFNFFIGLLMLRFFLQWVKADFYNPLSQFVMKMTNFALLPMRRVIPGFFGLDWAAVLLMLVAQALSLALIAVLTGASLSGPTFILVVIIQLITLLLNLYFFIIILRAILSFSPQAHLNPMFHALAQLSEPLYRPIRRIIPIIAGFDLSPMIALIGIQIILMLVRYFSTSLM